MKRHMSGIIALLPGERPRFIPVAVELFEVRLDEVADLARYLLRYTLGLCTLGEEPEEHVADKIAEDEFRLLYKERDIDNESCAAEFLKTLASGRPCVVRVLFRLLGGKGGFGSLLRSQKGRGKKTTNLDAMRDLTGRRLRHSKAVERIKEWLQKQKRDDELVNMLTGEGPELPKPTPESESLDPEFVRKLKRTAAGRSSLVNEGLKRLAVQTVTEGNGSAAAGSANVTSSSSSGAGSMQKAPIEKESQEPLGGDEGTVPATTKSVEVDWFGALDSLGSLSSPDPDAEGDGSGSEGQRHEP